MCEIMAEKQDIREDQMTEMTNPQKIRCLDSEGNSGLILLSTLLLKTMRNVGYLSSNDLKNVGTSCGYAISTEDGSEINGLFLSIEAMGYYFQIKVSYTGDSLKFRVYNKESDIWINWRSISFT